MDMRAPRRRITLPCRILSILFTLIFIMTVSIPSGVTHAQGIPQTVLNLPLPGEMIKPSVVFTPPLIRGITVHPENPLMLDFIIDTGDMDLRGEELKREAEKLIKYFLASLTIPERDLWVNLSPYESHKIIPPYFGKTEMGRDLLAQDYLLKQLTASITYPEEELGRGFWERIYKRIYEEYGITEIPMNAFNKVWIVPQKAVVYTQGASAFVVESRLRVMLEEDYLAMNQGTAPTLPRRNVGVGRSPDRNEVERREGRTPGLEVSTEIIRETILPEIEKEVNEGKIFANLRQIFHSLILAAWYKKRLKEGALSRIYVDRNKTEGIDTKDERINGKIYEQYMQAFQGGVYNYIKEDYDPATQTHIPRKYFSGGVVGSFSVTAAGGISEVTNPSRLSRVQQKILRGAGKFFRLTTIFLLTASAIPGYAYAQDDNHRPGLKGAAEEREVQESPEGDPLAALTEIFKNLDIEKGSGAQPRRPQGWETLNELKAPFADEGAIYEWDDKVFHSGKRSLKIKKTRDDKTAAWVQRVAGLTPGRKYEVSAWVKVDAKGKKQEEGEVPPFAKGATMAVMFFREGVTAPFVYESPPIAGPQDWRSQRLTFVVPEGYSRMVMSLEIRSLQRTVWWDDISIKELTSIQISEVDKIHKNELDRYGGWKKIKGAATGFFHTEKIDGRWWIITPDGNGFIVVGLQHMFRKNMDLERLEAITSRPTHKENMQERFQILMQHVPALAAAYGADAAALLSRPEAEAIKGLIDAGDGKAAPKVDHVFRRIEEMILQSPSQREWIQASQERLKDWGFNMVSHNSFFQGFVYDAKVSASLWGFPFVSPELRVPITTTGPQDILDEARAFPDVFDKRFVEILDDEFRETAARLKDDPWLLGYFLSNELPWEGDPSREISIFDMFFALSAERAGKRALVGFLREQYHNDTGAFNGAWGTRIKKFDELLTMTHLGEGLKKGQRQQDQSRFLRLVAETYFKLNYAIIKKYDSRHMILGARFRGHAVPREVLEAMGPYVDIVSFQPYDLIAPLEWLEESYQIHHKPILVTEFSFKAEDSGLPNTVGAGFTLKTQKDRALWYERYVSHLLQSPHMVGQIWYKYMDDPPRTEGENSNFGLVRRNEVPYSDLTEKIQEINQRIYHWVIDSQGQAPGPRGGTSLRPVPSQRQESIQDSKTGQEGQEGYSGLWEKGGIDFSVREFLENIQGQKAKVVFKSFSDLQEAGEITGLSPFIVHVAAEKPEERTSADAGLER